jgi:preprotein translocase SecE subunit
MRKVAWPTRAEVINSSIIVLIAVTFMTLLIFGYDWASANIVLFLFD